MNKNNKRPNYYEPRDGSELTCEVVMDTLISKEILNKMPVHIQHCYTSLYKYVYRLFFKGDDNAQIKDLDKIIHLCGLLQNFTEENKGITFCREQEINNCPIPMEKYVEALGGKNIVDLFNHDIMDSRALEAYKRILDITYYLFYSSDNKRIYHHFCMMIECAYRLKVFKERIKNSFYNSTNIDRLTKRAQDLREGKLEHITFSAEQMESLMSEMEKDNV